MHLTVASGKGKIAFRIKKRPWLVFNCTQQGSDYLGGDSVTRSAIDNILLFSSDFILNYLTNAAGRRRWMGDRSYFSRNREGLIPDVAITGSWRHGGLAPAGLSTGVTYGT